MNTINVPDHVPDQTQTTPLDSSQQSHQRLLSCAKWAGILVLLYLIGPFTLLYTVGIHMYVTGSAWQVAKRWARMNGVALLSLLWYLPIIVFHASLGSLWTSLFTAIVRWIHLPILIWFGGITIFPPVPSSTLLRWLLSLPLAGLLTHLLEAVQPRTVWETKRIITPEEQGALAAAQAAEEKKKIAQAQRKSKVIQTTTTTPPKPRRTRTTKEEQPPRTAKSDSLWGEIDWNKVPETHPLKQAVRHEAEQVQAKGRKDERNRWLAQQQASQQEPRGSSLQSIESTLTPPTTKPTPPSPHESDYNWDEGEGSIQE